MYKELLRKSWVLIEHYYVEHLNMFTLSFKHISIQATLEDIISLIPSFQIIFKQCDDILTIDISFLMYSLTLRYTKIDLLKLPEF